MNTVIYQVQVNNFENETTEIIHEGSKLLPALIHFKNEYIKGNDTLLYILDAEGHTLDILTSYDEAEENLHYLLKGNDNDLQRELREAKRLKDLYQSYKDEAQEESAKLKQQITMLQRQLNNKIA